VHKIQFVIPSLDYGSAARQLTLLAAALPRDHFDVRVAVLGVSSPWAEELRAAGGAVELLGRRRPFDIRPFFVLRRRIQSFRPDFVHVWTRTALHAVVLSGPLPPWRLIISAALPPGGAPDFLDRWLLRRARMVVALGSAEEARYHRLGASEKRLAVLAPAAEKPGKVTASPDLPGVPPNAPVILGVGPVEMHKGFREAVWAFDILAQLYPDVHLVVAGDGRDRARVAAFARAIQVERRVHLLGPVADLAPWRARATVAWVPSLREGGRCAALEAMAAGLPVVGTRVPALTELVEDGVTGFLVAPGEKEELARRTHRLLRDGELHRRLGSAGRERVARHFSAARLAQDAASLYQHAIAEWKR
jgi:glycosyltransferase involved in cell wall biosynthesis